MARRGRKIDVFARIVAAAVLLAPVTGIAANGGAHNADGKTETPKKKYSVSRQAKAQPRMSSDKGVRYVIRKGDTFQKIAKARGTTPQRIAALNAGVSPRRLKPGAVILIPGVAKAERKASLTSGAESQGKIYRVRKGETLYSISKKFNLSQDELKQINKLADDTLVAGMPLLISSLGTSGEPKNAEGVIEVVDTEDVDGDEDDSDTGGGGEQAQDAAVVSVAEPKYTLRSIDLRKLMNYSLDFIGTTYKYGGNTIAAIDCSAFVKRVFSEVNISLPRTSREQFLLGIEVGLDQLREGDLLFFARKKRINHVGMYIGNEMFIHAARKSKGVIVSKIDSPYVRKSFVGARRLFQLNDKDEGTERDALSLSEKPLIN